MFGTSRITSHWIRLLMSWAFVLHISNGGELETIFTRCCSLGATWAGQQRSCELYPAPISGVDAEHQTTCLATVGICCLRHYRILMCDIGKDDAIQNKRCWRAGGQPGGEFRKDCCDGCKLGLMAGTTGDSCSMNSFGFDYPWDEAFADCCQLGKLSAKEGIAAHHLGGIVNFNLQSNQVPDENRCDQTNPCQHNCHDTGGVGVECSCHPGYQLADDQRACVDVDECFLGLHTCDRNSQQCTNTDGGFLCLNENGSFEASTTRQAYGSLQASRTTFSPVQPPVRSGDKEANSSEQQVQGRRCPQGYEFNVATKTCNDVDECKLNSHNCNPSTHNCQNTVGGFLCLERSSGKCPPGYKYNPNILSCIDVDECAEGQDFCNRNREFCLNTIGGYECQPKSHSQCPAGYKYNDQARSCEDVDECEENLHNCDAEKEQCRNAVGGYECDLQCRQGFRYSLIQRTCVDIDECADNIDDCNDTSEDCANTIGSYECYTKPLARCPAGYKPGKTPGSACEDVDECAENLDSCDKFSEVCINDIGRYHCEQRIPDTIDCSEGYHFDPIRQECTDIDECAENLHDCDLTRSLCINTQGGFRCQILPCSTGYRLNTEEKLCEDINECIENTHNCSALTSECVNTHGSFDCRQLVIRTCPSGFTFNVAEQKCEDVNECLEGLSTCKPKKEVCVNTIGSYTCTKIQCPFGFRPNSSSRKCEDINECTESRHNCTIPPEECINTIGGFICKEAAGSSCPNGHRYNPSAQRCEDINECTEGSHSCSPEKEICINAVGSFVCRALVCPPGFRPNILARTCVDINECEESIHNCTAKEDCINRIGSFACHVAVVLDCQPGFAYDRATKSCEDFDECQSERYHNCHRRFASCFNTIGSFRCYDSCPPGHQNVAGKCTDIDECIEGKHNCSPEKEICVNNDGGFKCQSRPPSPISCPRGYRFNMTLKRCEDINECAEKLHECPPQQQDCINTAGSYECRLRTPQCRQGLRMDTHTRNCVDVDECSEGQHNCNPTTSVCVNLYGSFECRAKPSLVPQCAGGLRFDEVSRKCVDIDECAEHTDNCDPDTQICMNAIGTFRCTLKPSDCPPGYRYDTTHNNCLDINECISGTHTCDDTQLCINMPGSYQCQTISLPSQQCGTGFRYSTQSKSCVDIDECEEQRHNCAPREDCVNQRGSFYCSPAPSPPPSAGPTRREKRCPAGFHYNPRRRACVDIDECLQNLHNCRPNVEMCINTPGSFRCRLRLPYDDRVPQPSRNRTTTTIVRRCPAGFSYNEAFRQCVGTSAYATELGWRLYLNHRDVGYCHWFAENRQSLAILIIYNESGQYNEYWLDFYVNECQLGNHNCATSQRCDNTIGSFTCIRTTGCGTGYTLNAGSGQCEDDNECILGTHNCGGVYVCRNTLGSFRCDRKVCPQKHKLNSATGRCFLPSCNPGFEPDADGECTDINECTLPNACGRNQLCLNTVGSFQCQSHILCNDGYELNAEGTTCIDIDECAQGKHDCRGNQNCINRPGGYACQCPHGYTINAHRECEDIDECERYGQICTDQGECRNTPGSYVCHCKSGFTQTDDGKTCIDQDECQQKYLCQQRCINSWGSYQCTCDQGYNLAEDKRTCTDVDECSEWEGRGNLCIGICVNDPGSFSCRCPDGYKLAADKRTCQDIDECSQGTVCTGTNEVCLNTRGGFRCNTVVCPANYIRDTEHRNRCKRVSLVCQQGDPECLRAPLSFSYNYITFVSNLRIPASGQIDLFTMRGPLWTSTTVHFSLELVSARAPSGVKPASRDYFRLRRTSIPNQAVVSLLQSIPGPQDIEIELIMKLYSSGLYGGQAVAKIFIYVSHLEPSADNSITCTKRCQPRDAACLLNITHSITYQFVALPSLPILEEPMVITKLQAMTISRVWDFKAEINFLDIDDTKYGNFELIRNHREGELRLVLPIEGPAQFSLHLEMKLLVHNIVVASRHLIIIHIDVSRYAF